MLRFKEFIVEMAKPTEEIHNTVFYHGNPGGIDSASNIAKHGIKPPDLENRKKNMMTPVDGKTYATPHIGYAQIYAMGGNVAGTDYKPKEEYGHVFAFKGKKLKDIQPDEDDVGQLYGDNNAPDWLNKLTNKHVSAYSRSKAKQGEYAHFANIGKRVIPHMTDDQKIDLIQNHNTHVANEGTIKPDRAYRLHRDKIPLLKNNGSNFFDHAEEIDMKSLADGVHKLKRKRAPLENSHIPHQVF